MKHDERLAQVPADHRTPLAAAYRDVRCWWCDAPADRVCDISLCMDGAGAWFETTCDAPLCCECTTELPLLCGPPRVDVCDECPYCHALHAEGWAPWEYDGPSMPDDHPVRHRERARAHAREHPRSRTAP